MRYGLIVLMAMFLSGNALGIEGNVEQGQAKSVTCTACHGNNGNSTNPLYPTIAGKDAAFIYERLNAYKKGEVKTANAAMMNPMAASLTDEDMKNLAAYFSVQKVVVKEPGKKKRKD